MRSDQTGLSRAYEVYSQPVKVLSPHASMGEN